MARRIDSLRFHRGTFAASDGTPAPSAELRGVNYERVIYRPRELCAAVGRRLCSGAQRRACRNFPVFVLRRLRNRRVRVTRSPGRRRQRRDNRAIELERPASEGALQRIIAES